MPARLPSPFLLEPNHHLPRAGGRCPRPRPHPAAARAPVAASARPACRQPPRPARRPRRPLPAPRSRRCPPASSPPAAARPGPGSRPRPRWPGLMRTPGAVSGAQCGAVSPGAEHLWEASPSVDRDFPLARGPPPPFPRPGFRRPARSPQRQGAVVLQRESRGAAGHRLDSGPQQSFGRPRLATSRSSNLASGPGPAPPAAPRDAGAPRIPGAAPVGRAAPQPTGGAPPEPPSPCQGEGALVSRRSAENGRYPRTGPPSSPVHALGSAVGVRFRPRFNPGPFSRVAARSAVQSRLPFTSQLL